MRHLNEVTFMDGVRMAIPGIVASAVFSGIGVFLLQLYIKERLEEANAKRAEDSKIRRKQAQAVREWRHAIGRLLFWMHRAIVKPPANGELENAWALFQQTEDDLRGADNDIISDYEARKVQ